MPSFFNWTAERYFMSVASLEAGSVKCNPSCSFLRFRHVKITVKVTKVAHFAVKNIGKLFGVVWMSSTHAPVHKS